jgi:hypothetical protein
MLANKVPDFEKAAVVIRNYLTISGFDVKSLDLYFLAFEALRKELSSNPRACDADIKQLSEKVDHVIAAGEFFLDSQPGLANFKTDPFKKNDPLLAEFYETYKNCRAAIKQLITDSKDYFTQETANSYAAFNIVLMKIFKKQME